VILIRLATVWSGLVFQLVKPDCLISFTFLGNLKYVSVTPKALLLVVTRNNILGVLLIGFKSLRNVKPYAIYSTLIYFQLHYGPILENKTRLNYGLVWNFLEIGQ
jgi:hypothetical protein